ncbi:MAG: DUF2244 domain-containing protein [Pseudomonadota bacterium]
MAQTKTIETLAPDAKGRHLDLPRLDAVPTAGKTFEALLYPNRSLPNRGFVVLMAVVIAVNVCMGIVFTLNGAWPVLVFGGLDILLVWAAFKTSYAQGRLHERIRVTADEIVVSRVLPSGHEMRWALHPFWTDLQIDDPIRHESQLCLRTKGKVLILGTFLSPDERLAFAKRLQDAITQARCVYPS